MIRSLYRGIILIMLAINSFAYNIDDYKLFNDAIIANEQKDYKKSLLFYKMYENNFSYSYPLTSNYAKFFIAKNYMDLKDYDKALLYFSRAVYVPERYIKQETKKTNFFQYKRDFYVGNIYMEKKDEKKAIESYTKLVTDYYDPTLTYYEKKALKILEKYDIKYRYIYEIKYENNLKSLKKLSKKELEDLSNYFYEKKDYTNVIVILDEIGKYNDQKLNLKIRYLESLLRLDKLKQVLELTQNLNIDDIKLIFIRGVAYEQARDYSRAIFNYNKLNETELQDFAFYRIAKINYILGEYKKVKFNLDKIDKKNEDMEELALDNYIKLKDRKNFIKSYKNFENKYPENIKMGLYYMIYTKLTNKNKKPWELSEYNIFFMSNYIVRNYKKGLPNFRVKPNYKEEVLKSTLYQIGQLENADLLELAIKSNNFDLDENNIDDKIIIVNSLIESKFYDKAFQKIKKYSGSFFKYNNLLFYLYPKYYREEIENIRKNHLIQESLIYTIIYKMSEFNKDFFEYDRIGLMGLDLKEVENNNIEKYYDPIINLEFGIKKLKKLYEKNNELALKTLVEYIYGERVLKSLNFESDGDIRLETITDEDLQKNIEEISYIYSFYTAIYN